MHAPCFFDSLYSSQRSESLLQKIECMVREVICIHGIFHRSEIMPRGIEYVVCEVICVHVYLLGTPSRT